MSLLVLRNLVVFHEHIHAVRRVTLHVNQGEIVALVGSNGAGKTTLLSTISGLLRPRQGSILFDGVALTAMPAHRIVRLGVSHVPEGRHVFRPLSVEDNLRLGAYARRWQARNTLDQDLKYIYTLFPPLQERRRQPAGTLSGGEQQMLAMGRALMARPRLLLLDEPSMGLAPRVVQSIFRHIQEFRKSNLTVLLVEQNAQGALAIADRGYVMENGRITLHGTGQELLNNHDVQRAYLGREQEA